MHQPELHPPVDIYTLELLRQFCDDCKTFPEDRKQLTNRRLDMDTTKNKYQTKEDLAKATERWKTATDAFDWQATKVVKFLDTMPDPGEASDLP